MREELEKLGAKIKKIKIKKIPTTFLPSGIQHTPWIRVFLFEDLK